MAVIIGGIKTVGELRQALSMIASDHRVVAVNNNTLASVRVEIVNGYVMISSEKSD